MFERILGLGMVIGVVIRDLFGFALIDQPIMICGSLLGFAYLFANWWMDKPEETSFRTIAVTILYGIASWCLTFALIFKLLYLSGSDEMTIMGLLLLAVAIGVDLFSSIKKTKVLKAWLQWRLGILTSFVVLLYFIPEDFRISITYRNYNGFLEYYQEHKANEYFYIIKKNYFDGVVISEGQNQNG